ncbi:hypothetical protein HI914_06637 [Erysiphe necator]|nr:hypothetical protein HI914_06637 [Erysiphe necator]
MHHKLTKIMISKNGSRTGYSDPSDKWMARWCVEPPMDSQTCALSVFCPCILVGKIRWRIKQKELNLDPLQSAWHRKYCCNSPCCSSIFCLCPWYITKYYSEVRSLYAISSKKSSKVKNFLCCACSLLQLDREIRAREGETRLRTNLSYKINPVLTEPELSLPMKYVSPYEAKARSNNESVSNRRVTTKNRKVPDVTKRFATENTLERQFFILRDVYSQGGLTVEQSLRTGLGLQNNICSEKPAQEILKLSHRKNLLKENNNDPSTEGFTVDSSSEFSTTLFAGKNENSRGIMFPKLALGESTYIGNSNENLPSSRSLSSLNLSTPISLESPGINNLTKDHGYSFLSKKFEDNVSLTLEKKFDANSVIVDNISIHENSGSENRDSPELVKANDPIDLIGASAMDAKTVKEGNFGNPTVPIFYSELMTSDLSQGFFAPKPVSNEKKKYVPKYAKDSEKTKLLSYKTVSSATLIDIPKSQSQRLSKDKVSVIFASGTEDASLAGRSMTRRAKLRGATFIAPNQIDIYTEDTKLKFLEQTKLQVLQPDTRNFDDKFHNNVSKPKSFVRQGSDNFSTDVSENSQNIGRELLDEKRIRSNPISKLPICINREIRRNQLFNRPRLSPILSNENIYRQREIVSRFHTSQNINGKSKEMKEHHDKNYISNILYPEIPTKRDITANLSASLSTEFSGSISQTQEVSNNRKGKANSLSKIEARLKGDDEDFITKAQTAKKALRLFLVRTLSGVTD